MIYYKPYLKVQRLIVLSKQGKVVYDEKYKSKLNIIRGTNSSGKSTIANFIFYAIGGDFNNWTTEAEKCDSVFAELNINGSIITTRRNITLSSMQPMYVFWGNYEDSIKKGFENWEAYTYRQSETRRSFSNIIFSILNFPELKGDYDNNITLNQILRLMYIDQKSPTMSLFKFEPFDSPLTRKTIAELLFGTYDDQLYYNRLKLRDLNKNYEEKKRQVDGILQIYSAIGNEFDIEKVEQDINDTKEKLKNIQENIGTIQSKETVTIDTRKKLNYNLLQEKFTSQKRSYFELLEQIKEYEYEIEDSNNFIKALTKRRKALEDSSKTREGLGELKLTHCPNCLSPLEPSENVDICFLCKSPLHKEENISVITRMGIELENQIKESQKLLIEKEKKFKELKTNVLTESETIKLTQRKIDEILEEVKSTRNREIDELYTQKGQLESKIEFLIKELKAAQQIKILRNELDDLDKEIKEIRNRIEIMEKRQIEKYSQGLLTIEKFALMILRGDLERQSEFKFGQKVDLDFSKDTFGLDGRNNFSESSNTYLKNAVRFGIFFASLELEFFRYPRFILCDNTEDKGMEEVRSQNFQKIVSGLSDDFDVEHQIILTTSMIDAEMNNEDLCIGSEYSTNNKSLNFNE